MADKSIKSVNLLPEFLQTNKNSKFLASTIDQLIQKPQLERIDGYIGSTQTVTYNSATDVYISETLPLRRDYQLDPTLVVKDVDGNVSDVIALDDLINEINIKGGQVSNLDRLFRSDFYSYNPQIDWDKLVNYQDYYWLVTGPNTVTITGQQLNTTSTYSVTENSIGSALLFDAEGAVENPLITLYRGNTYNFSINSAHPFYIKTYPSLGIDDQYSEVENNGTSTGVVTIVIPNDDTIPDSLFYISGGNESAVGQFVIKSIDEDSQLDVIADVLGKKDYTSGVGVKLSNGMKIRFGGYVIPESYRDKDYFVEGVGTAIKLIEYNLLDAPEAMASQYDDDFDATPFDDYPFDNFKKLPLTPEYITINRASQDLNPWSRYNRWVHKDVITASADATGQLPVYPINLRAKRPIIEFRADIKLFNFGTIGSSNIDLVDTVTLDAFSNVEGSAGHHIDGVLLEQGHRVVFAADTDIMVREKIFEVRFVTINDLPRLTLHPVDNPISGSVVAVNLGNTHAGTSWWFDGDMWKYAQQHDKLNQAPLFDLFDNNGHSYADTTYYTTDFKGNKILSYDVGTGTADAVLGFPLKYRNSVGVGSYLFKNYFMTDTISIVINSQTIDTISTGNTYFKIGNEYINVWTLADPYTIPQLTDSITGRLYYETPLGLTNNPLNGDLASLTLSEFADHVNSMIGRTEVNIDNNLRDVEDISASGKRLISNANPMAFAHFFIGKKEHSVVDAVTKVADQYSQFKLSFLKKIIEMDDQLDPVLIVDQALKEINAEKDLQSSFYLSDMVAYGSDKIVRTWTVTDSRNTVYPITTDYDPTSLTLRSVLVYLNGEQLIRDQDYVFVVNDSSVEFLVDLAVGDVIVVNDYTNTSGSFVPSTPTKLGLYPKFIPGIFTDTTYVEHTDVIQGHDGSIMIAYGDYRDAVILELEKRIYNNLKAEYKQDLLDINSVLPGAFRNNEYSLEEINQIIGGNFAKWAGAFGIDYTKNTTFDLDNNLTWNYTNSYNTELDIHLTGSWRAVYKYFYDTERPHSHPWEMLGFINQPSWWEDEYGPSPYTSGNDILWTDIEQGVIRQGTRSGTDPIYARPGLSNLLPVDEFGDLVDPTVLLATNITDYNKRQNWKIGEQGPAETAWRRSSYWPFMVQKLLALAKPASYAALMYDPIRLEKNIAGQWTYGPDHEFLNLKTVYIQGDNNTLTSGYSTYVSEVGRQRSGNYNTELKADLAGVDFNLFYKVGGFVSKDKLQIIIDSIDPTSTGVGAILPQEDYDLILNTSNPIKSTSISGLVIQKSNGKFVVKGYDLTHPYFNIYTAVRTAVTPSITVGGVSEPYLKWSASATTSGSSGLSSVDTTTASSSVSGKFYQVGQVVEYGGSYYRVQVSHRSESTFNASYFQRMPYLPTVGGVSVQTAAQFDKNKVVQIPYGTEFSKIQDLYDLIIGYGAWLEEQGFTFDEFNSDLQEVINWDFTAKEFLYWTTQNWASNSVITLSPFADQIKFKINNSVVDNVFNSFYEYGILQANGFAFPQQNLAINREDGTCTIKVTNSVEGMYFARLNSIQKEHAMVFNNTTMFNDTVYDIETGYRQRRMKLLGFRTAGWDGDYFSPGFIYDTALISDWKTYTDYKHSDVVRFAGLYYSANGNITGTAKFDFTKWTTLGEKPVAQLLPNFDYKISQFEDFYSLDIDNFDSTQQQLAQHLIGYTPRVYLNNIFTNPISQYKFYQGFIKEKGTRNSISRLAKASIYNLQGEVSYNEEWAFRIGSYGSYETYKEIEVPLIEGTFIENPQIISFVDSIPTSKNDLVHYSLSSDLVIKPVDYNPATTFVTTSSVEGFKIDVAGYVRFDDIDTTAYTEDDLLTITDVNSIPDGQVTWVGFTKDQDWDALRYTFMSAALVSASMSVQASDAITFNTDEDHELAIGEYISVAHFDDTINGVYTVNSIPSSTEFTVINTATDFFGSITPAEPGLLFKFISTRHATFDSIPSDNDLLRLSEGSKLWIDSNTEDGEGRWQVYNKASNYQNSATISASENPAGQKLGWSISKQKESSIVVTGAPEFSSFLNTGTVFVYGELENAVQFKLKYGINDSDSSYLPKGQSGFGYSVAYDEQEFNGTGYGLIIAGAPFASNVRFDDPDGWPVGYPLTDIRYADISASTSTRLEEGLVKISSVEPILIEEQTQRVLLSPNPSSYERFGQTLYFNNSTDGKLLLVGAPQTSKIGTGNVYAFWMTADSGTVDMTLSKVLTTSTVTTGNVGALWGYSIAGSDNAEVIAVGAPGYLTNTGLVSVFSGTETNFVQTITSPFAKHGRFGESISISPTGEYMFISATEVKNTDKSLGKVAVYKRSAAGTFDLVQTISNPVAGVGMKFGRAIDIDVTETELYISAIGTNNYINTIDPTDATFDWLSTIFLDSVTDSGTVYIYNKKTDTFKLANEIKPVDVSTGTNFGYSIAVNKNSLYVGSPTINTAAKNAVYQFYKVDTTASCGWQLYREQDDIVEVDTLQKVTLIDAFNETVVDYLDVVDPLKGKLVGLASQDLKYRAPFDPAVYSIGTDKTVNDVNTNWLDEHVGELWWDLSTVKYVWYEQGDLQYRKNNWGKVFPGSSIDVYEWVGSELLPSEWSALADTPEGLVDGISGQPKDVDNTVVSVKQVYNSTSNSFSNYYYFWVKNKLTVPNVKNRRISGYQVASLIADPTSYGVQFAAVIADNAIALSNIGGRLVADNIHLNVSADVINNNIPRHTEWLLLQEGSSTSVPNTLLEKKLLDSLLGHDSLGNPVPDPTLSVRTRYGIGIRPRQTLFKDRASALRNLIEFANDVLINERIVGNYSLTNLKSQELPPDQYSGEYDQIVEDIESLALINTDSFSTAKLTCNISNGKIVNVNIIDPGFGYKNNPKIVLVEEDTASLKATINGLGQITEVEIVNAGTGLSSAPTIEVRPYTVIVLADIEANGKWTKRIYNKAGSIWIRSHTQTYNTPLYWKYVDWNSDTYNQFVDYSYTVDEVYELNTLTDIQPGNYVKVKDAGLGTFVILEKTAQGVEGTFDTDYNIVYSENGTVQILDSIWDLSGSNLGFDQNNTFDQTLYSQEPDLELQYILTALKNDIFVNELKINWNLFFFKAVKYAMSEQKLLDWAFKTSFINVVNNAGSLDQRPVYKLQNSQYFEDYIREVKPYHTNIRSFTENYSHLEPSGSYTTDFDLPSYYDKESAKFKTVEIGNTLTNVYPWKSWADNYKYEIGNIIIGYGGSGYTVAPSVELVTAAGDTGSGATARAYIRSGEVIDVEVVNPGSGYTKSPRVIFSGGGDNVVTATVHAQLLNGKVRTNTIGMKFDRTSRRPQIENIIATDNFICNGSDTEFILSWVAEPDKSKISATLNGSLILGADYTVEYYNEYYGTEQEYNKHYSKVVFLGNAPVAGQILTVTYTKHTDLLNAADRIINYYTATSGMPGLDLGQLMTGIVYPKTRVEGLMFDYTSDWDMDVFGQSAWADDIGYYTTVVSTSTSSPVGGTWTSISVNTTTGIAIGQYVNVISTTTNPFNTNTVQVVKIDGVSNIVTFNTTTLITINNTSTIELWTYDSNATALDSAISAGTWNTSTRISALGINPEDITIDGSGFLTADSSYAPEELLPGEINESLGINVYTKNAIGSPVIVTSYFTIVNTTTTSHVMEIIPATTASVIVSINGDILSEYDPAHYDDVSYSIDWDSNTIVINSPDPISGVVGYSIVDIGTANSGNQTGLVDKYSILHELSTSTIAIRSVASIDTVKSAYVTVNGIAIPSGTSTSTSCVYELTYADEENNRATVIVYNLITDLANPHRVSVWFFGTEQKYFNEIKSEILPNVEPTTNGPIPLINPPGVIEPICAQAIVEFWYDNSGTGSGIRQELIPPYVDYYSVTNVLQTTFEITNNDTASYDYSNVRVYINGSELRRGFDYTILLTTVRINQTLNIGDVIAIVSLTHNDYDIINVGGVCQLTLRDDSRDYRGDIKIITYNDHDSMLMRTESFDGNLTNRYKISRPILNDNYIWVSVNGGPLVNKLDYVVLEDGVTVQLADTILINPSNTIVIRSMSSSNLATTILGYRVFNDIFNRTHFKRLSKQNTTYLTKYLTFTDTEIHVADASVLTPPLVAKNIPGVVIIDGERIEFFTVTGNVLGQLRRSTLGTAPSFYSEENTRVIDQSPDQTIPFTEQIRRQSTITNTSTVYPIITTAHTSTSLAGTMVNDGIVLSADIDGEKQVAVYYGGRQLNKVATYFQDIDTSYDSQLVDISTTTVVTVNDLPNAEIIGTAYVVTDLNQVWVYTDSNEADSVNGYVYRGLNYIPPEFTVDTTSQQITLNIVGMEPGVKLTVIQRNSTLWNDTAVDGTLSLMESTTLPARFLQARPAELPDTYYYGGETALIDDANFTISDENNDPLEGF